jgi:tetratricopeptide (TPR) repeat protein
VNESLPSARPRTPAPKAAFDEALALLQAADPAAAERVCRATLERHPRDVNLRALLGAVLVKLGRPADAEAELRAAIADAPTFAKPHEDLGYALVELGRIQEAVPILERATHLDPKLDGAWFSLGKALARLGRGPDADRAFERCFALSPERRLMAFAAEHHREGRLEDAERLYRRVLREWPRNVDALRLLGTLQVSAGRHEEAERLFERALALAPDYLSALLALGRLHKELDRYAEALACFERALALAPDSPQVHFLRGSVLAPLARTDAAMAAYRRCLELRPGHSGALLGLGHVLKTLGEQHEAIATYRRCLAARPDNGETWWSLANLKVYRFSDEEIAEMTSRVESGRLEAQSEVNLLFALAKAWEDRGEYERAWGYYHAGNLRQRAQVTYDPVQTEALHDRLLEIFSREFLAGRSGAGLDDGAPIFIVGLPRSGSTLLEQILASHSEVEGTSELPYLGRIASSLNRNRADGINYPEAVRELGPEHLRALGSEYLELARVHRHAGKPRFIDKMPNNFPNVGLLALILPRAKIIDARRHPLDACLGCYRQLFARGQTFTYDLTELGEYYLQYQRMMDHWAEALPGRVLTVQYESVVADLESEARRLLDFCELTWDDACLRFHETVRPVRTASSEQVRRPIYADAVGHWRRYETHLGELLEVLAPLRERYARYEGRPPSRTP